MPGPPTLIAEDLLLLLLDDASGSAPLISTPLLRVAVLVELVHLELVGVEVTAGHRVRLSTTGRPSSDPVLADALADVAGLGGRVRSWPYVVPRLVPDVEAVLTRRLVERGLLEPRDGRLLGVVPQVRMLATDDEHEAGVRNHLHAALVEGADTDPRTALTAALLWVAGRVGAVVDSGTAPDYVAGDRAAAFARGDGAGPQLQAALNIAVLALRGEDAARRHRRRQQ